MCRELSLMNILLFLTLLSQLMHFSWFVMHYYTEKTYVILVEFILKII